MVVKPDFKFITFKKDSMEFKFLDTGDIFEILNGNIMINLFNGVPKEGSLNNIYLRIYDHGCVNSFPLLGIKSKSKMLLGEDTLIFRGEIEDKLRYEVKFTLFDSSTWFYSVDLYGDEVEFDLLFFQDVGISDKRACLLNELYTSQYIDHSVYERENGFILCSRQNQDQGGIYPYVEHGCINSKVISYSTDQMKFFSKEYKYTDVPYYLDKDLDGEIYQFELSHIGLQTEKMVLNDHRNVTFYGVFSCDHRDRVKRDKYTDEVYEKFYTISFDKDVKEINSPKIRGEFSSPICSEEFSLKEIFNLYTDRKFEEYEGGTLLSFFTNDHSHVVTMEKELLMERPHGHIIMTGASIKDIEYDVFSSTNYMYGVFNSHVVIGNTSLNKMISVHRGLLNVLKNSGQRIYIKIREKFRMLTMPYMYEMGLNFSRWYYKIYGDVLMIESYVTKDSPNIILSVKSLNGVHYEFIITNQFVIGDMEFNEEFDLVSGDGFIEVRPREGSFLKNTYNDIHYRMIFDENKMNLCDDSIFFDDDMKRDNTLICFKVKNTPSFNIVMYGSLSEDKKKENSEFMLDEERDKFNRFYYDILNGFKITSTSSEYDLDKINEILYFYAHNALIHFSSPHGLEQSGGAAWGTRDVCQGAVEFFLATNNYGIVKKIILKVFNHQFYESGRFPQWFMFDDYNMQQDDSHGDIIFWPLKVLSEYVCITGDKSIFKEEVSYVSAQSTGKESILDHVKRAIESIERRFIGDTHLINYGGGDWDDTLQPVDNHLKERLVSTWTMCLAYQTLKSLHSIIEDRALKEKIYYMYEGIQKDLFKYGIKDDVISGFIYLRDDKTIEYMLHPSDNLTNIHYRLLPLTRSIIGEVIPLSTALINEEIIDKYLTFPDGVRLMDTTPSYNGGVCKIFKRAEQASNVGREISLQYVHAHIRFIEAMCKLHRYDKVWEGLFRVNPIKIGDIVSNADYRQSNSYFSSSEGNFRDRYDFKENFNKLKDGSIKVKGGWRIYSSGPGLYISQIITNVLGIRYLKDKIIFDPVIPIELDNLEVHYKILDKYTNIIYRFKETFGVYLNGEKLNIEVMDSFYNNKFIHISRHCIEDRLYDNNNVLEIYIKK